MRIIKTEYIKKTMIELRQLKSSAFKQQLLIISAKELSANPVTDLCLLLSYGQ